MIKTQFAAVSLSRYIKLKFNGNKAAFARHMGVLPQQVTKWINGGWLVADEQLYSPRREVNKENE